MKKKKVIALIAVAAAVSAVALGACAKKNADDNSRPEEEGAATETVKPDTDTETLDEPQAAKDELTALLERVQEEVQPGTAGCSLKAASIAVELLKWGDRALLSEDEVKTVTEEFIAQQGDEYFSESIALVDESCANLQGDEADGVLDDIGLSASDKTWGAEALPLVEALMEAAGLR